MTDQSEKARRIEMVAHYLIQGYTHSDIVRNCKPTWNVTKRTIENYIRESHEFLVENIVKKIEERYAWHQATRLALYRDNLKHRADVQKSKLPIADKTLSLARVDKNIMALLRDMARIDGLYVERVELTGKDGEALIPNVIALPDNGRLKGNSLSDD
jgi:hypothetical protein